MRVIRILLMLVVAIGLTACGSSKFKTYNGPKVTSVQVHKADRKMYLLHNERVLKKYDVALGFNPDGHKQYEGDGRTPEGTYVVDRRNPNSQFHLSVGINYPRPQDVAYANFIGKSPGGDIFIHGRSNWNGQNRGDWTHGCIAVTDKEMETVYAMIKDGTTIHILP
ncbi:L,D-transpeptidase family protein [Fertoebacter nigrum]|uniref:L,D-transpeptidase family protein n=1 Tax=Fertoeibacter niger TaxID=2656921 RepID=A0A8X8GW16_9RHOB|nr:L,D-transpeptidase family protein [Fertoeibacter niger]NUB45378.1 L,D-transpeptidase family protein [Fertoeibacter niger]